VGENLDMDMRLMEIYHVNAPLNECVESGKEEIELGSETFEYSPNGKA